MPNKTKKIRYIFFIYWFLLAYIIAALIWWFISLNRQNEQMTNFEIQQLNTSQPQYTQQVNNIQQIQKRKTAQYIGEGVTFFLLIAAGAAFVFRAVQRQLQFSMEQQNFMMALTHELKTPIAVTKLNLETLQKRKLEESQQQRLIQTTLQEANRMNSLCNNMLLSSQIEASGFRISNEEINFSDLVATCVQDFITRYPQRNITTAIAKEIFADGDQLLLQMAVNNLVENAIKYAPKETTIAVSVTEEKNNITLQVKDEGKGIADEEKKKVFNKFYRIGNAATKGAKGTGLGLYLTRRILHQHNGNISVTDNFPTGSIFTVNLQSSVQKN
ncbi:sensor histidine kinase [Ferruginibacter sp. SUN106]|uniref:sensor histidine kinase n=1 Tax=Ferruginibacter sp. SUN106 TaxID=2978348 RepID=UPI003D3610D9